MKSKSVREAVAGVMAMRNLHSEPKATRKSRALDVDHYLDDMEMRRIEAGECDSKGINLLELSHIKYRPESVQGARKGKRGYEASFANAFKGSGNHA